VRLFVGALAAPGVPWEAVRAELEGAFGAVDSSAGPWPHTFTDYYADEMGRDLSRAFFGFADAVDPGRLPEFKERSDGLERELAAGFPVGPGRPVNLDPGYVHPGKVVLATRKDYAHRVYLARQVYAEVTLIWRNGGWLDQPWTYPDYRSDGYKAFLTDQRRRLLG
jgi:hypothetical protein